MNTRDRNVLLLGILIILLVLVGYYLLLLGPKREQYNEAVQERSQKQQQLSQLRQQVEELEQVRRNAPEIERQLLELAKRVPSREEIPTLLVQLEEIGSEAGVTQLSIEPGQLEEPPGGGDFSRVPITMTFEGTYEQLQDLVTRMQNLVRLVTINEISYEPVEGTTVSPQVENLLQVEIQAEVYVQDLSEGAPASPAPAGEGPEVGEDTAGETTDAQ